MKYRPNMKTLAFCLCLSVFTLASAGEGRLSKTDTQRYAKLTDEMVMSEAQGLRGQRVAKGVASKTQLIVAP